MFRLERLEPELPQPRHHRLRDHHPQRQRLRDHHLHDHQQQLQPPLDRLPQGPRLLHYLHDLHLRDRRPRQWPVAQRQDRLRVVAERRLRLLFLHHRHRQRGPQRQEQEAERDATMHSTVDRDRQQRTSSTHRIGPCPRHR